MVWNEGIRYHHLLLQNLPSPRSLSECCETSKAGKRRRLLMDGAPLQIAPWVIPMDGFNGTQRKIKLYAPQGRNCPVCCLLLPI